MAVASMAVVGTIVAPFGGTALALEAGKTGTEAKTSPFCTNLSAKMGAFTGQITTLSGKATQAWTTQDQKLLAEYQKVDQDVTADRQKADTDRSTNFTKLEAKATTDAQKQAVKTYEAAVHTAVDTRRSAYDTARQAFRTGVKGIILARRDTVTAQLNQFKSTVAADFATTQTNCTSNPSGSTAARETLMANLKTARQTFQNSRKNDETVGSQVKQLAQTRNDAFKAADQAFKASMTAARTALKQAFGNNTAV